MPVLPVPASVVATAVQGRLQGPLTFDAWRPAVQGAVGHVLGLRDGRGDPYVVKTFPPGADERAATEVLALRMLDGVADVPVPGLVLDGELPADWGSYIVMTRLPGVRWADRRAELDADQQADLFRDVAALLRGLHGLGGSLVAEGPRWPTAWDRTNARCGGTTQGAWTPWCRRNGLRDEAERRRLEVHVLLLTLAEWTWVVQDQPPGWTRSEAVLDAQLRRTTT